MPYTVGLVELDEGPRLEAPLVGDPLPALRWRMGVGFVWAERGDFAIQGFAPVAGQTRDLEPDREGER